VADSHGFRAYVTTVTYPLFAASDIITNGLVGLHIVQTLEWWTGFRRSLYYQDLLLFRLVAKELVPARLLLAQLSQGSATLQALAQEQRLPPCGCDRSRYCA
jgi:hypothetical protein